MAQAKTISDPLSPDGKSREILLAISECGVLLRQITPGFGDVFAHLRCEEADALASIFQIAGDSETAVHIILRHSEGDDDSDDVHAKIGHHANLIAGEDKARRLARKYVEKHL